MPEAMDLAPDQSHQFSRVHELRSDRALSVPQRAVSPGLGVGCRFHVIEIFGHRFFFLVGVGGIKTDQ
jgi:hypothetical protein